MLALDQPLSNFLEMLDNPQPEWLRDYLVYGADFSFPADYGDSTTYLIDNLSTLKQDKQAAFARVASQLLLDCQDDEETQIAILRILKEIAFSDSELGKRIGSYLIKLLQTTQTPEKVQFRRVILSVVGRSKIHGVDWLALLANDLTNSETAIGAQLVLEYQNPELAQTTYQGVFDLLVKANIPTEPFVFLVKSRQARVD